MENNDRVFYYHILSQPSKAVKTVIDYGKLDYKPHFIKLDEGEQQSEWFLKINPAGVVPALKDGDFLLGESVPIMKYLHAKHNMDDSLYPADPMARAQVDGWLDWAGFSLRHSSVPLQYLLWEVKEKGGEVPEDYKKIKYTEMERCMKNID